MVAQQKSDSALPTLGGSYPAPTVPPTANAPYMQASRLPQDFVFIVVGGALAFVAFLILAWRVTTAWSINRSFKRHQDTLYAPLPLMGDMKKSSGKEGSKVQGTHGMSDLTLPRNFSQSANSSLFFSPTAAAINTQRPVSQHLPAGHYMNNS